MPHFLVVDDDPATANGRSAAQSIPNASPLSGSTGYARSVTTTSVAQPVALPALSSTASG